MGWTPIDQLESSNNTSGGWIPIDKMEIQDNQNSNQISSKEDIPFLPHAKKIESQAYSRPDSIKTLQNEISYTPKNNREAILKPAVTLGKMAAIPFQRTEAAVANAGLEVQKGEHNPGKILSSAWEGISGKKQGQLGDLVRTTGFGENIPMLGFGNVNEGLSAVTGLAGSAGVASGAEMATKGLAKGASKLAPRLAESAENSYVKALGGTTAKEKNISTGLAPELTKRKPFVWSRSGWERAVGRNEEAAANGLENAYQNLPLGSKIQVKPIIQTINQHQKNLKINGVLPEMSSKEFDALDNIKADLIKVSKNKDVSLPIIRAFRQKVDSILKNKNKGFKLTGDGGPEVDALKAMGASIRREISNQYPDIAKVNKEYSFWSGMSDLLEKTVPKTKSALSNVGAYVGEGSGHPFAGAVLHNFGKIISDNVAWNSFAGSQKARLAELLSKGNLVQANSMILKGLNTIGNKKVIQVPGPSGMNNLQGANMQGVGKLYGSKGITPRPSPYVKTGQKEWPKVKSNKDFEKEQYND